MGHAKQNCLSAIIIDDEKVACTNLSNTISHIDATIKIQSYAYNTAEAEKAIRKYHPDAIFLDINMPEENAFQFLERIQPFSFDVVFVTAYDEYAIQAFKLNAVDYILKPIAIEEVAAALEKLKQKKIYRKYASLEQYKYRLLEDQLNKQIKPGMLPLREFDETILVDIHDILFIEAKSSYAKIHFIENNIERSIIMSHALSEYEILLPDSLFYRIHKSYLINCSHVRKIGASYCSLYMAKNNVLPIGRRRHSALVRFLKENNFGIEM